MGLLGFDVKPDSGMDKSTEVKYTTADRIVREFINVMFIIAKIYFERDLIVSVSSGS